MSEFVLKRTRDGMLHLYLDDPDREDFLKISQAKEAKFLKTYSRNHVVLTNDDTNKTLFGILDNDFFQVILPKNSHINFVDGVCIYEKENQCYMMEHKQGCWCEKQLGEKHDVILSFPDTVDYKKTYWVYFIRKVDQGFELSHFVDGEHIVLGRYCNIIENGDAKIFTNQGDSEYYDIYTPKSIAPLKGDCEKSFEAMKGVFIWNDKNKSWRFHEKCSLLGQNAIYRIIGSKYGENIELYRVENGEIKLFASGCWEWKSNPFGLCVEGVIYSINDASKKVDFDNPQFTLKKWFTNLFKQK